MLLIRPKIAESENRVSIPVTCQIQPPNNAIRIDIKWLTEIPVVMVALTSSSLSEMSWTYTLLAIAASDITESKM